MGWCKQHFYGVLILNSSTNSFRYCNHFLILALFAVSEDYSQSNEKNKLKIPIYVDLSNKTVKFKF